MSPDYRVTGEVGINTEPLRQSLILLRWDKPGQRMRFFINFDLDRMWSWALFVGFTADYTQ